MSGNFALCHEVAWKKREKSVENRQSDVSGNFALCHEVALKKGKIGQGPREQCVEKFRPVPRGGVKRKRNDRRSMIGRGPIERCVRKVRHVPRGGIKKEIRSGTLCATSFGFVPFAFSHEVA